MSKLKKSRSPRPKRPVMSMVDPNRIIYQPKYRYRRSRSTSSNKRRKLNLLSLEAISFEIGLKSLFFLT